MNVSLPVCHSRTAPPCRELEQCIELITHKSSARAARCGNNELIGRPLSPCWWNSKAEPTRLPIRSGNETTLGRFSEGSGRPLSRFNKGLGSKVSRCEGPPNMKSMITRRARAGKWDGRGASGLRAAGECSARSAASASEPKPAPIRSSACRRETDRSPQSRKELSLTMVQPPSLCGMV